MTDSHVSIQNTEDAGRKMGVFEFHKGKMEALSGKYQGVAFSAYSQADDFIMRRVILLALEQDSMPFKYPKKIQKGKMILTMIAPMDVLAEFSDVWAKLYADPRYVPAKYQQEMFKECRPFQFFRFMDGVLFTGLKGMSMGFKQTLAELLEECRCSLEQEKSSTGKKKRASR